MTRLLGWWEGLRSSFWFVPALMALAAAGLAAGTVTLDAGAVGHDLAGSVRWLWSGDAEGARALLSMVASSMVNLAGTVFTITIAALTLASSQFGPRLLRNFTRDSGNQVVLGTFVATFLYCLLVMRTVRSSGHGGFVPYLSVTCGVGLAVASIGVLIYFIHHVATSIQAEKLVAAVGRELRQNIDRLCPPAPPGPGNAPPPALPPAETACLLRAPASGYLQQFDREGLVSAAEESDLVLQVPLQPGDFVLQGDPLLRAWGRGRAPEPAQLARLRGLFTLGSERTPIQDVRYGIRQLTEVAARALSPSINNPFTAIGCADWLADALALVAGNKVPSGVHCGGDGQPRLLEQPPGFAELLELGFGPLRIYGAGSALVTEHLLRLLTRLAAKVDEPDHRLALLRQAELIGAAAQRALGTEHGQHQATAALESVRAALARSGNG